MRKQDEVEKWKKILNIPFLRGDLVVSRKTTPMKVEGTPLLRLVLTSEIFLVLGLKGKKVRISDGEILLADIENLRVIKRKEEREIKLPSKLELLNLDTGKYETFPKGTRFKLKAEKEGNLFLRKEDSYYLIPLRLMKGRQNEKAKNT